MSCRIKRTMGSSNENARSFESFFQGWLVRQEHILDELNSTLETCHESSDEDLREVIGRVLAHYQHYYQQKSRMANRDVFLVFSPTWFTIFERTFFWIAGYKPGLAFTLVNTSLLDLTQDQKHRMAQLKDETKAQEKELADVLAKIQESVSAPPLVEMARLSPPMDGEIQEVDSALESLREAMESVLGSADLLRARTAERVIHILTPPQAIKFLASATQLQLRIRMWGLERKGQRLEHV